MRLDLTNLLMFPVIQLLLLNCCLKKIHRVKKNSVVMKILRGRKREGGKGDKGGGGEKGINSEGRKGEGGRGKVGMGGRGEGRNGGKEEGRNGMEGVQERVMIVFCVTYHS
jgi:hypothetical protein